MNLKTVNFNDFLKFSIIVGIIAIIVGIFLSAFDFVVNLSAEILGVILGALATYFIVERLLEERIYVKWKPQIKKIT